MATFDDIEKSAEGGAPVMLIRVTVGDAPPSLFCDAEEDFVYAGETFKALPLKTGSIKSDVMLQSNDVGVTLPRSDALFPVFWPNMPRKPSSIEIRQTHYGAEDAPLVFSGSIFSSSLDEERTSFTLNAKSSLYQINKVGSRRKWQTGCPFVVYGGKCRASEEASKFAGTATLMLATNTLIFNPAEVTETVDDDNVHRYYVRDMLYQEIKPFYYGRSVEGAENFWIGSRIVLEGQTFYSGILQIGAASSGPMRPFFKISDPGEVAIIRAINPSGAYAEVIPDCNRTIACCRGIHRNQRNYGGQPALPYESPVGVSYVGDR